MDKIRIDSIKIERLIDECPDISYLETTQDDQGNIISSCKYTQEEYLENPKQIQSYINKDNERLEQFYSGDICMMGVIAKTEVSYPINNESNGRRIERFASEGLWGIESDSDEEFLQDIQKEQLWDLKEHLNHFNVDLSNFEELAQHASQTIELQIT